MFFLWIIVANGDLHDPTSLHYLGSEPSQYELALRAIGDVIQVCTVLINNSR